MTDSLSPRARELLDGARAGDDPTDEDRARVRRAIAGRVALGVAAAAAVTTTVKVASGATVGAATGAASAGAGVVTAGAGLTLGIGTKVLLGAAFVGMVSMGTASYLDATNKTPVPMAATAAPKPLPPVATAVSPRSSARVPAKTPAASEVPESPSTETATAESVDPVPAAPIAAAVTSTAPRGAAVAPRASTPAQPEAPPVQPEAPPAERELTGVAAEIALLRDAHAALSGGDAARSLALLDLHAQRFPRGAMGEEREATRVFALCAAGRTESARAAASAFLRIFPNSLQAARVRTSCGGPGSF